MGQVKIAPRTIREKTFIDEWFVLKKDDRKDEEKDKIHIGEVRLTTHFKVGPLFLICI